MLEMSPALLECFLDMGGFCLEHSEIAASFSFQADHSSELSNIRNDPASSCH